jgi:uncharacterized membrane protein
MFRRFAALMLVALLAAFLPLAQPARAATFSVTTTADSGAGSLRQAITSANANGVPDSINFNITGAVPAGGYWTITLASPLPDLTEAGTTIDGSTQPNGRATGPKIVLDGSLVASANGLNITSSNNTIEGLSIVGFRRSSGDILGDAGVGIRIVGTIVPAGIASGNKVIGCWIGVAADGATPAANTDFGILIDDRAQNNTVGGTVAGEGNVIAGNGNGLSGDANVQIGQLQSNSTNPVPISGNKVIGNYIGTRVDGTAAIGGGGNLGGGVVLSNYAQNNTIGGTTAAERNVIAGHTASGTPPSSGVSINAQPSRPGSNNVISGNYIGTAANGTTKVPNTVGVWLEGASSNMIGGATSASRNIISGNNQAGVELRSAGTSNNTIANNWIGLDASGNPLGNAQQGVNIPNNAVGTIIGPGNVISANQGDGVALTAGGNTVKGNFISTNSTGTATSAAFANNKVSVRLDGGTGNTIGGPAPADRNVIALGSNEPTGIHILGPSGGNFVYGNYIGVNASGGTPFTASPPLGSAGILINLGSTNNRIGEASGVGAGNVIGGNYAGIKLENSGTTGNLIKNNSIGVGSGGQNVGNQFYGIWILSGPTNNTIGGALGSAGNLIAYNGINGIYFNGLGASNNTSAGNTIRNNAGDGIRVQTATGVRITQTQTTGNGFAGIALPSSGNGGLAAPTLQPIAFPGGVPTLSGNACANCIVEVFTSPAQEDGEGPRYLAVATATAGGAFSVNVTGCDPFLAATARDPSNNNTSAFSPMIGGCVSPQPHVQLDPASPPARTVPPGGTALYQHRLTNSGTGSGTFTIARSSTQSGWTIQHSPTGSVTLAAGQFRTIYVTVTVPLGTLIPNSDQTTITASIGGESDSQTDTTTVQQAYGVVIDPPARTGSVTPGPTPVTIDYTHYITNTGNGADTINLTTTSSAPGASATILGGASCALAAGAGCTKTVRVTIPANSAAAQDQTTVTARSAGDASKQDQAVDTTQIRQSPIPEITPDAQTKDALPSASVSFNHTVRNIGGATGQFTVTVQNSAPAGWTFGLSTPSSFSLAAGASRTITLTVTVAANADAGALVPANLKVDSASGASDTAVDTTRVLLRPAFTFTAATQPTVNNAQPAQTVVFTHTLTNQGNGTDTFNITIAPPAGWTATPIGPITLARNASQTVVVRVQVPGGQGAGSYPIDVTAQTTSTPQPAAQTHTDTVIVVGAAVPKLSPGQTKPAVPPLPATVSFTHILTNTGNQAGTFSLSAAVQGAPAGWSAAPSQPSCSLVQNASCTFTVNVTVPAGASAGDQAIVVTASIAGPPPASDSVTDIVRVPNIPGVQFTPDYPSGTGDPGAQVTYIHTLTNTGNGTDSYTITLATTPNWSAISNPNIVANVPRGATRTVTITVTVPSGVLSGSTGIVTATATSARTPHPSASVVDRTTINAKPGATLIPNQQTLSANPTSTSSDTVTFQHTLRNTGSIAISYTLTTTNSPPNWTTVVTPTQVGPLAPGAETTVAVGVTVPQGTAFGEVMTTTLKVQQFGVPTPDLATARDVTRVGPQFGALLTPPLNRRSALPGTTVVYTHTLRNSGLDEDTFLLSTIAPNGWDTRVAPSSVSLPRNGSTIITVTVQVPTSALSTTLTFPADLATVRAQSVNDVNGFGTAQEETTVLQVAGVSLSPPRIRTATPGNTIQFQHTLLNSGNGLDTFDLTWTITGTGVLTWTVTVAPTIETLLTGESNPVVMVRVQVPANAAPDVVARVIVTATSRSDPRVTDRLEDLLIGPAQVVPQQRIYLPFVAR